MGSEATDGKTRFRKSGAANDSQKQTNEGLANAADAATLGSGRQRRSRLPVAVPQPKEIVEDACVEEDITSTAPSGRRNEPVDRARRR